MSIVSLSHATAISADLARTRAFYTDVLGLRAVPAASLEGLAEPSLAFSAAEQLNPPILSFLEWADRPRGNWGVGGTHHIALAVTDEAALRLWRNWLLARGSQPTPIRDRKYFHSVYFTDPDGLILELATLGPGFTVDEPAASLGREPQWPLGRHLDSAKATSQPDDDTLTPDRITDAMRILGLHHVSLLAADIGRTTDFMLDALGLSLVKQTVSYDDPAAPHFYFGDPAGAPGALVTYFGFPGMRKARLGPGVTHHIAVSVAEDALDEWEARLRRAGIAVTAGDRALFLQDPDGQLLEMRPRDEQV